MRRIALVEDTESLRNVLTSVLSAQGFSVQAYATAEEALNGFDSQLPGCVLSDFRLPGISGIQLLTECRKKFPELPFVIMTAFGSVEIAVEAMRLGASDFITKPFEPLKLSKILDQIYSGTKPAKNNSANFRTSQIVTEELLTDSAAFSKVISYSEKLAAVDTSVLILGESGTGKEVLARYIHNRGPRSNSPFIGVNCAAIPAELLESEFFGHEVGAFTGATQSRVGIFEAAGEGTVFLDEVAEMPALMQVKLLRALQENEFRRVGGSKTISTKARVVCATNKDINEAIRDGELREDFFYRIAVVTLTVPPLRDRKTDIRKLVDRFNQLFCARFSKSLVKFSDEARDFLEAYSWPGNIRELENVIERVVVFANGIVTPEELGVKLDLNLSTLEEASLTLPEITARAVRMAESQAIEKALANAKGNKSQAARVLGVSYKTLLSKVREYGLFADE